MAKIRVAVDTDEASPEYALRLIDTAKFPNAGIEVDREFVEEYDRVTAAWSAMQAKLGQLGRTW